MTKENIPKLITRKGRYHYANNMVNNSARKKPVLKIQALGGLMKVFG